MKVFFLNLGNSKTIKDINRSIVLNMINEYANISRGEIAKKSGLSPSTVSFFVEEAIKDGILYETGSFGKGVGRKSTSVSVNPEGGVFVGFDLSHSQIAVLNLKGEILKTTSFTKKAVAPFTVDHILSEFSLFAALADISLERIMGLGISVPGIVNEKEGEVILSKRLNIERLPLKKELSAIYDFPVYVVNDLNAALFMEQNKGTAKDLHSAIYMLISQGTGASILFSNQFHQGKYGQEGTITDFYFYTTDMLANHLITLNEKWRHGYESEEIIRQFLTLAYSGNGRLLKEVHMIQEKIASNCSLLLQFLDVDKLIFHGWITDNQLFFNDLKQKIHTYEQSIFQHTKIEAAVYKDSGAALGAARIGVSQMFKKISLS